MRLTDVALLVVTLAVPFAAFYGLHRLSRWHAGAQDPVDALIAKNAAQPRDGMDRVDWNKTDRAGEARWQDTLRAQRRTRTRDIQPRILPMNGTRKGR